MIEKFDNENSFLSEQLFCGKKRKGVDGLTGILMALQIDLTNTVDSFETVFVLDPFDKNSINKVKKRVEQMEFYDVNSTYSAKIMGGIRESINVGDNQPPKCMFLPSQELIRNMVKANVLFAKTDTKEQFLLRFGLLEKLDAI